MDDNCTDHQINGHNKHQQNRNKMTPTKKKSQKMQHSKTFLSKIAANIGPSFPLSLLHQLKEGHVQHCNLHANHLSTLDIDEHGVVSEGDHSVISSVLDYDKEFHGNYCEEDISHSHDSGNNNNNDITRLKYALDTLVELDVSSNRIGHNYNKKKSSKHKERTDTSASNINKYENDESEEENYDMYDDNHRHDCRTKKTSILSLCPNLRILNISSNDLTTDSLASLFCLAPPLTPPSTSSPPSSPPPPPPPASPPPPPSSTVQIQLNQLVELNLSHNGLSNIPNNLHRVCPHLQKLNIEDNFLSSTKDFLQSLYPLKESLTTLFVNEKKYENYDEESLRSVDESPRSNPMCLEDCWRQRTICILSNLVSVDGVDVSMEEREEARFALEIGWMNRNDDDNNIDDKTKRNCRGEMKKQKEDGSCKRAVADIVLKKDGVRRSNHHEKSVMTAHQKGGSSNYKIGKGSAAMPVARMAKMTTTKAQRRIKATAHTEKEHQSSTNNHPKKATDVVAKKFDKALSGIQERQWKIDHGGHYSALPRSSTRQVGDKRLGTHFQKDSTRERRQQRCKLDNGSSQFQMSCDESESTASTVTSSQLKLNKLESRVNLLSELAGEQAEVTERLLLLSGSAKDTQKNKSIEQPISMVSNASTQADIPLHKVDSREKYHDSQPTSETATKNMSDQTSSEAKWRSQKKKWILLSIIKKRYCADLKIAFHRWKFHNIISRYKEQLENKVTSSKEKIEDAVNEAVQQTTARLSKKYQVQIEEIKDKFDGARQANVKLKHELDKLKKELRDKKEHQIKIKHKFEQDMMLLGEASEQKAQRLALVVQLEGEHRLRAEKDQFKKEIEKMERDYNEQIGLHEKEKEIACKELLAVKKALNSEKEEMKSTKMRWKQIVKKKETELQKAKEETLKAHEQEREQTGKKMQDKMLQFKQAFEMIAKRAASDRAKCERALCNSKEYITTIERQKVVIGELEKKVQVGEHQVQRMKGEVCSIHGTNAEMKQRLIDLTEKHTKCSITSGMKDVKIESLEKEREVAQNILKQKDEQMDQLKCSLNFRQQEQDRVVRECLIQKEKVASMEQQIEQLQESFEQAAKSAIREENDARDEALHLLEMEKKKMKEGMDDWKQTANAKNEALQKQVNQSRKELQKLDKALGLREKSIKQFKNQALMAQAAFETNKLSLIRKHQKENDQMHFLHQRDISILREKLSEVESGRDEARKMCMSLEVDAKALAQELFVERNKRFKTEEKVKSLSEALDSQRIMMQNAIEGICKQSSKSILGQDKF